MNWQNVAFDWNQARAFLATAEKGSLSAAARALGLTQPTVGRQVAALEADLGVTLFDRVGRGLILTPSGLDLLEHVRAMGEAAGLLSVTASGRAQAIAGQVCITASDIVATYHLPPVVARLREVAPEIEVEILVSNAIQDLRRREADIAVRHVRPEQPDLIARLVNETTAHLYASRRYLDRHGRPTSLADLADAHFVAYGDPGEAMRFLNAFGLELTAHNFPLDVSNGITAWEMVRHGLGIGVMTRELGETTPEVEALLPDAVAFPVPVWLATHRELRTSRRIRLVFDLLAEHLGRPGLARGAGVGPPTGVVA
ncbi:MAG: LysR family transcriptional regulator [Ectothiorhodospiraceae bacterium]|nr:LysR family transcriptional regulator [Ectothiorhodospiraceae bacterium]